MAVRIPLWLSSVRSRPTAFAALVALSALAVVVAALTPMLTASVAAIGLRDAVAAQRAPDDGVGITTEAMTPDLLPTARNAADLALAAAASTGVRLWTDPVTATATSQPLEWFVDDSSGTPRTSPFGLDDGGCDGIRITAGRCPTTIDEVALPRSAARAGAAAIGSQLAYRRLGDSTRFAAVVGVYDDAVSRGALMADPSALVGSPLPYRVHDPLLGAGGLSALTLPLTVYGGIAIDRPVRADDVRAVRAALRSAQVSVLDLDAASTAATLHTDLGTVLTEVDQERSAAETLTAPIGLQALALAWFALGYVTQRMARARAVEWGIGRTRGLRRSTWLASIFVEPLVAIVVGSAIGYPIAVALAVASSDRVLGSASGVSPFGTAALASAALAVVGSLVALVVASARSAVLPLDALLRETTEPRRLTRGAFAIEVAAVLVLAMVVWSVETTRSITGTQLATSLLPLLALVAGILAMRLGVLLVRRAVLRRPRSVVGIVAGRGLARAPSALAASVLVVVAFALADYALETQLVVQRAQDARADLAVGAATVLTVSPPAGSSLLELVRKADPSGRIAMAAEEADSPEATSTDRLVAVDTSRLAAVSTWRRDWRGAASLGALDPDRGPELALDGTRLTMRISALGDATGEGNLPEHPLRLDAVLDVGNRWVTVHVGGLRAGTMAAAIPCSGACRLVAFEVSDPGGMQPWGARFTIDSIATDVQPAAELARWLTADRWRDRLVDSADPARTVEFTVLRGGSGGLALSVRDQNGGQTAELEPARGPAQLPGILGAATDSEPFAGLRHVVYGTDLSRRPLLLRSLGRAPALPRALDVGALVDLGQLEEVSDPGAVVARKEVWLTAGSHPAVLAALRAEGVRVLSTETTAAARADATRTLLARALVLVLATAGGAMLLALLALVAAWVVDAPSRRVEWRALRLAGCSTATLRRVALVRFALPAGIATLLGAPVECLAFALAAGRLPLTAGASGGPPLDATPPSAALAALTAAALAAVVVIGVVGARVETRERP